MRMDRSTETADRATLRVWRITNVLGWSLLSLSLALFLRRGFEAAADILDSHSLLDVADWLSYWEYALFVLIPSSVLCGLLIGSMIGARIVWRPAWVSGTVAAIYAVGTWVIMRSVPTPDRTPIILINAVLASLTVLVAVVVAARVASSLTRVAGGNVDAIPLDR
jgi:hypothetical protein